MTRDELIALVTHTLGIAQQRGDVPIIEICTELGSRLVAEVTPPETVSQEEKNETQVRERAAREAEFLDQKMQEWEQKRAECPVCADRRQRRNAVQRKHRSKKRGAANAAG